jgi:mannose-6-phosphate isomerase-like protein (cupin superfamily)
VLIENPLIDIGETRPQQEIGHGWDPRATVRIGISGRDRSSTLAYHAVLPPGAGRTRHLNANSDEILIYLQGGGVATVGETSVRVRAGHCQFVPKGVAHAFASGPDAQETVIVGFYPLASGLSETGFTPAATQTASSSSVLRDGAIVHLDDVPQADMNKAEGWFITDFRLPVGRHNGSASTLFRARFMPGAVHKKHRHDRCEEIYFVISGSGIAGAGPDRVRVHGGHFHYVPKGVEHWLSNLSASDPIEVVGIYIGSGTVQETGYVYRGDVTADDLVLSGGGG